MEHLVAAVRASLAERNWYAALSLALTLPDIAAKAANPEMKTTPRYTQWADKYVKPFYTRAIGPDREEHTSLSGSDCYALRCAVLHEGSDQTVGRKAAEALHGFIFLTPSPGLILHDNQMDQRLQLQVDIFCEHICKAVEAWLSETANDAAVTGRVDSLMKIHPPQHLYGIPGS